MSSQAAVHAIIPQSLLEAIRNLDTPLDDGLNELANETVAKRLGLSATVASQIQRYRDAARRGGAVSDDEAVAVFRLVGRRPDATLVYSDAGRRAARYAARTASRLRRGMLRVMPRGVRRKLGVGVAISVARRVFALTLDESAEGVTLKLSESLATRAGFEGTGCYFYSALVSELLRVTSGFEGAAVHERCRSRTDDICRWRTTEAERLD